ncbi:hypothetical protein MACJ_003857 [Theileria orientalis]|uniref:Uncharacterized protein n=1 Tax=Theileria orientalis TaxID=68886 RepID=A0A976XII9_THEOR|nr:hypothetical protein MACJ_003857 [Theileria orientalis]
MGGSYSDLNVYLRSKKEEDSGTGYKVTSTKKNFEECCNFVVFTHKIIINDGNNPLSYNVLLYDGYYNFKGNYFFGYYYPSNDKEVIEEVRSYYSVLAPNVPLVISFVTKGGQNYNCLPGDLKNARWNYASHITEYSSLGQDLTKEVLDEEFKKLLLNRKIKFTIENEKEEIGAVQQKIKNKNFRFIFIPIGKESVLGIDCLFSLDVDNKVPKLHEDAESNKNKIDPYFLTSVKGQFYDGIFVYFDSDEQIHKPEKKEYKGKVLLLEFIDYRNNNICLRRKDAEGCWWSQEKVPYNNDKELLEQLMNIKKESDKAQVVTVILDKMEKYKGVQTFRNDPKQPFNKYTFTFDKPNKPVFLFKTKKLEVGPFTQVETKPQSIEVYYLKAGGKEDSQPFLIVFEPNGRAPNTKKAYHFKDTYKFEDWKEFKFDFQKDESVKTEPEPEPEPEKKLIEKLYEKVGKIETNGSCIPELSLLRWYAHEILIDPEISKPPAPPTKEPERPKEEKPKDQPKPLSIPLIVGGSVGGVVFVVSSAVGYGIYWYNTTIKLLT